MSSPASTPPAQTAAEPAATPPASPVGSAPAISSAPPPAAPRPGPSARAVAVGALLVVAGALLAYLPGLGGHDLWAPDEPRFGQIGREMVRSGDWVVPRMNDEPVALLPPLTYWLVAAPSAIGGEVTPWTARIGLLPSAIATLLAVYLLGVRIGRSRGAGLAAAAVLGTTSGFHHQARFLQADLHLLAGTTAALLAFHVGWRDPERRRWAYPAMGVAIGWAILAKGPVGFVVPGLVVLVTLLRNGGVGSLWRDLLRRPSFWGGVAAAAAVALPWYLLVGMRSDPAFARELLVKHNFGMFFDTWSHDEPFYYYLTKMPVWLIPWIAALPAAVVALRRRAAADEAVRPDASFLVIWFVAVFLFFSIADAKQAKYLLPIYPAAAIAIGLLWARAADAEGAGPRAGVAAGEIPRRLTVASLALLGGLALLLGLGALVAGPLLATGAIGLEPPADVVALGAGWSLVPLGAALLGAGGLVGASLRRGALTRAFAGPALAIVAIGLFIQLGLTPAFDPVKSGRNFAERLAEHAPPGEPFAIVGFGRRQHGDYIFYTERPVISFRDEDGQGNEMTGAIAYLRSEERVFVAMKSGFEVWLASLLRDEVDPPPVHELFRVRKGSKELVVVSNRPSPPSPPDPEEDTPR